MGFSISVGNYSKDIKRRLPRLHAAVVLEYFSGTILDTPVDQGRLAANWMISDSNPSTETTSDLGRDVSVRRVESFVSSIREAKDRQTFLTNNLPYAARIEFDGWSHTKAPQGMVRINRARVAANLRSRKL